jgi:ATP-binding cassette subfamily B protein
MKTFLRVWKYTDKYKRLLITSLCALLIVIAVDLVLPIIFKTIIDDYLVGIEKPWYQVDEDTDGAVDYNNDYYLQYNDIPEADRAEIVNNENVNRILLINNVYYFINSNVSDGTKEVEGNQLFVTDQNGNENVYKLEELNKADVFNFYQPAVHPIMILVIIHVVLNIIVMFATYLYRLGFYKLGNRVTLDLRKQAFEKIQKLHISYFDKMPAGKIVARVTNDTQSIIDLFSRIIVVFTSAIIMITGTYISLFFLDARLAAISLLLIPILLFWGTLYRRGAKKNNKVIRSENSEINAYVNQSIKGMEVIQAFNREDLSFSEFQEHNTKYFEYKNKMLVLNSTLSGNLVRTLHRTIQAVILLYFGWGALGLQNVIAVGVIYAFIEYINKIINPINQIFNNLELLEQSLVNSDRIFYLLDQPETTLYYDKVDRFKGDIQFKDLNFAYEKDNYVLKNINLNVKSGQTIAIVGHTGSGKSSMMNVMLRFYDFDEGQILIDGVDIRNYSKQAYRKHVGIVLQDPVLFTGTIASNISLNNSLISDEMIEHALRQIGAERFIDKFTKGIQEPVLEMGSNFSTGERQLISFARAMIYDPAVLVLDEATANIDTETELLIQKALHVVKRNRTTFIIAHRLSTIKDANQIIVLEKGNIVEQGYHDDLMNTKGKYYDMYQSQLHQI